MKRSDVLKKKFIDADIKEEQIEAIVEIQNMIANGTLKIQQLDPKKAYVFTLGNDSLYPSADDLSHFRDLIMKLSEEPGWPSVIVGPYARIEEASEN